MSKKQPKITFLIPTYGGLDLLKKNLPSVMKETQTGDEVFISEDAIDDLSCLQYFRRLYDLQPVPEASVYGQFYRARIMHEGKSLTFSFLQRKVNGRFARNVNDAVALIAHHYFFLLNNDVRLTSGCREHLLTTILSDTSIFAVTAKEIDVHNHSRESGRNQIWWARGRFWHARDENLDQSGPTAWACGGSSLYDVDKWQVLGGFDTRYYPAYWEDIDVSWNAAQRGWRSVYCHKAVVHHVHETTNKDVFGQAKIEQMSWDNGTKFTWKNARGRQKLEFLFYYFYWQLKQFPALRLWAVVLFLAASIRLGFLNIPAGLTVDEAALAYNGYAVVNYHRDEWLNFLPVTFRSFGDYKAPLLIYVSGLVQLVAGTSIWALRLPTALIGVATVWLLMQFVDMLIRDKTPRHQLFAALAGFSFTFSWWHFHFSHLNFETNWAVFFQLWALYELIKYLRAPLDKYGREWQHRWCTPLIWVAVSWCLALYSYHASKLTIPLTLLILPLWQGKKLWQRRRNLVLPLCLSLLLLAPLLQDSFCLVDAQRPFSLVAGAQSVNGQPRFFGGICGDGQLSIGGNGMTRANSSFLTDANLAVSQKGQKLWENLLAYFQPAFLLRGQNISSQIYDGELAPNVRHGDAAFGVLWWTDIVLLGILLATLLVFPDWRRNYGREVVIGFLVVLVGTLPAIVTAQIPHSNQALGAVVGWVILTTLGFLAWRRWWSVRAIYYPSLVMLMLLLVGVQFGVAQKNYLRLFAPLSSAAASSWQEVDGNVATSQKQRAVSYLFAVNLLDAFQLASQQRQLGSVKQIIYAGDLEQPYIYALTAERFSPEQYRYGKLSESYMFVSKMSASELTKDQALVIYNPEQLPMGLEDLERQQCQKIVNYYHGQFNNLRVCWTRPGEVLMIDEESSDNG